MGWRLKQNISDAWIAVFLSDLATNVLGASRPSTFQLFKMLIEHAD